MAALIAGGIKSKKSKTFSKRIDTKENISALSKRGTEV